MLSYQYDTFSRAVNRAIAAVVLFLMGASLVAALTFGITDAKPLLLPIVEVPENLDPATDIVVAQNNIMAANANKLALEIYLVRLDLRQIAGYLAFGLTLGSLVCLDASRRALKIIRKAEGADEIPLDEVHTELGRLVTNLQTSAVRVVQEARTKEADVEEFESRLAELQALANVTEPQAAALSKRLNKGTWVGIYIGLGASVILTIVQIVIQSN